MNAITFVTLSVIVLLATANPLPHGKLELYTVPTAQDGNRYYISYNPLSLLNSTAPAPVALVFHELGDSCMGILTDDLFAFQAQAEAQKVIIIAPCGLRGSLGHGWNAGVCCGFNESGPDDVAFTLQVVQSVTDRAIVNASSIGAFGMGNGAFFAQNLICTNPDTFSFAGTVSGLVTLRPGNLDGLTACTSSLESFSVRPRSVTINGDQDGVVGWSGEPIIGLPTPVENFMRWGSRNQCQALVENWNNGNFESRMYTSCLTGGTVEMIRWWGGGHDWPTLNKNGFDATNYLFRKFLGAM